MAAEILSNIEVDAFVEVFIIRANNVVFTTRHDEIGLGTSTWIVQRRANGFQFGDFVVVIVWLGRRRRRNGGRATGAVGRRFSPVFGAGRSSALSGCSMLSYSEPRKRLF